MRKTAMQEMLDWINEGLEMFDPNFVKGLEEARFKATELLEKEKQQIVDAYNQGYRDGENSADYYSNTDVSEYENANIYYTQTFTQ